MYQCSCNNGANKKITFAFQFQIPIFGRGKIWNWIVSIVLERTKCFSGTYIRNWTNNNHKIFLGNDFQIGVQSGILFISKKIINTLRFRGVRQHWSLAFGRFVRQTRIDFNKRCLVNFISVSVLISVYFFYSTSNLIYFSYSFMIFIHVLLGNEKKQLYRRGRLEIEDENKTKLHNATESCFT